MDSTKTETFDYDNKTWINWSLVEQPRRQPVENGTLVEIVLHYHGRTIDFAEKFDWEEKGTRHAIYGYRVIQPDEGITGPGEWRD